MMLMMTMGMKIMLLIMIQLWACFRARFFIISGFEFKFHIYGFNFFFFECPVSLVVEKINLYSVFLCLNNYGINVLSKRYVFSMIEFKIFVCRSLLHLFLYDNKNFFLGV